MSEMAAVSRQRQEALDLLNMGAYKEAEPLLRVVAEQTQAKNNAESWMWQRRVLESLVGQGKFAEAEPVAQRALKGFEGKYGPNDEDALDCKFLLAESLHGQRKNMTAQPNAQTAYEGMEANLMRGPEHHTTLLCKALCAAILQEQGRISEAKALAQSTLERLEAVTEHTEIIAAQGSRRLNSVELLATEKVKTLLAKVLNLRGKFKDEKRHTSIETVSTHAPDPESDDERR